MKWLLSFAMICMNFLYANNLSNNTVTQQATVIDVLILHSESVNTAKLDHLITVTNTIYKDSGLNVQLNVVHTQAYALDETKSSTDILYQVTGVKNGYLVDNNDSIAIRNLRNQYGADQVLVYRPYANDGICGVAWVNSATYEQLSFAHVSSDCGGYVTAHEIGHNMGLVHSFKQDGDGHIGKHNHSRGHGVDNRFTTVMTYESAYNGTKVYKFSDPSLICEGEACGIKIGHTHEAHAVHTIKETAPIIANYRKSVKVEEPNEPNSDQDNKIEQLKELIEELKKKVDDKKKVYENSIVLSNQAWDAVWDHFYDWSMSFNDWLNKLWVLIDKLFLAWDNEDAAYDDYQDARQELKNAED